MEGGSVKLVGLTLLDGYSAGQMFAYTYEQETNPNFGFSQDAWRCLYNI